MTPPGLTVSAALVLLTSVGWAGLDVVRKQLSGRIEPVPLIVLLNLGLLPSFAAWWYFGVDPGQSAITDLGAYLPPAGAALALQIVANLLFLMAVRASPFSLTIPFLSLTPVFAAVVGRVVLNEQPRALQIVGMVLVVAGALTLGLSEGDGGEEDQHEDSAEPWPVLLRPLQIFARERGAWMMTTVAACWGVTSALDKVALEHAALPLHALTQVGGVTLAAALWLVIRGRTGELRVASSRDYWWIGLGALVGTVAIGAQLAAIQHVMISAVETTKRAVGLVSAVALGRVLFGEAVTAAKVSAALVMGGGVALLMLG